MKKILFVCTGNTCRSTMAEGICNKLYSDKFYAKSCGVAATCEGASQNAVLAVKELYDTDISSHISKQVSKELLTEADIIFAVSKRHADILISAFPEFKDKVIYAQNDISDPFMQSLDVYKSCAEELRQNIETLYKKEI